MQQLALSFETHSPINKEKLSKQNRKVFDYLSDGKTLDCFKALTELNIMHLHSRLADVRKAGVIVYDRYVHREGNTFKEYSLKPFK